MAMAGAVLAVFVGLKVRSSKHILPAVVSKAASSDGSISLSNFEYRDVKEGTARWTVWATTATYFEDRQETVLDQVKTVFFLKNGDQVLLTGDTGLLHNDTQNMEISGNVKVSYEERYRLSTERLLYDRDKALIHTGSPILLEGKGIILKGQGMRLELENRTLSVLSHIETTLEGIVSFGRPQQGVSSVPRTGLIGEYAGL